LAGSSDAPFGNWKVRAKPDHLANAAYRKNFSLTNVPIGTVKSRLARLQMQMKLRDAFEEPVDLCGSSINRNAEDGVLLS
jgi:hypothetical protein